MMGEHIKFLREREAEGRKVAAGVNPCADPGDKMKLAILERADQFKACADVIEKAFAAPTPEEMIRFLRDFEAAADNKPMTTALTKFLDRRREGPK